MPDIARELAVWADRYVKDAPKKAAHAARERATSEDERTRAMSEALFEALDRAVRCRRCGKRLTDPRTIAEKIGDDCAELEQQEKAAS